MNEKTKVIVVFSIIMSIISSIIIYGMYTNSSSYLFDKGMEEWNNKYTSEDYNGIKYTETYNSKSYFLKVKETDENYKLAQYYIYQIDSMRNKYRYQSDSTRSAKEKAEQLIKEKELAKYHKTPAGRINKKHPKWSKEDCERIVKGRFWIGMEYDMLIMVMGKPDRINKSNYGDGREWQLIYEGYDIDCFYFSDKGGWILEAYN